MSKFGNKILSAFVETSPEKEEAAAPAPATAPKTIITPTQPSGAMVVVADRKFADHFDKLFSDTNLPGPDYYEFSKMVTAMSMIPDERSRYIAAFAGLQVQGLDKQKLLSTTGEYLKVIAADAAQFQQTVDAASKEKVADRTADVEKKKQRMQELSQEIMKLQEEVNATQLEIEEDKNKLYANSNAYSLESNNRKQLIEADVQKITAYIQ